MVEFQANHALSKLNPESCTAPLNSVDETVENQWQVSFDRIGDDEDLRFSAVVADARAAPPQNLIARQRDSIGRSVEALQVEHNLLAGRQELFVAGVQNDTCC